MNFGDYKPSKISPIIKVNYLCNLSCKYCCYNGFKDKRKGSMSTEMAYAIMEKALKYNIDRGIKQTKFYWHGGEPTLNGLKFFENIVNIQLEQKKKYNVEIKNSMQTNGILINKKWIEFFKKNSFSVGVSIDGPSYINDTQRVTVSGKPTTYIVMDNIKAITQAGVEVGVLSVISNKHRNALNLYDFYKKNQIDGVGFCKSFVKNCDSINEKHTISNNNLAHFMNDFFDLYFFGKYQINQREYEAIMRKIIESPGDSVCTLSGRTSCGMFPTINFDGDVFFCDDFDLIKDQVLGNIIKSSFDDIFNTKLYRSKKQCALNIYLECSKKCDLSSICGGGCPRHDLKTTDGEIQNYYCESFKSIIFHIRNIIEGKFIKNIKQNLGGTINGTQEAN